MRLASLADFEGGTLYSDYRRYPYFSVRADTIVARYGKVKTLVVGCGWGFLVDELAKRGVDAWGIDASSYAITKGKALAGASGLLTKEGLSNALNLSVGLRLLVADGTNRTQLATVKTAAGLAGNAKFPLVVTEDVLPVLTTAEQSSMLTECRRVGTSLLHIVTPGDPTDPSKSAGLHWKPASAWKTQVSPDMVLDAETGQVS